MARDRVFPAEPYRFGAMGSLGDAACMLLRQFNFPDTYDGKLDQHLQADHDRMFQWDHDHTRACFQRHLHTGELGLEFWLESANDDQVFALLKDLFKVDRSVTWTGYRVLGSVHRGNGYPVYTLELFAKHRDSHTKVYTGANAHNVQKGTTAERHMRMMSR